MIKLTGLIVLLVAVSCNADHYVYDDPAEAANFKCPVAVSPQGEDFNALLKSQLGSFGITDEPTIHHILEIENEVKAYLEGEPTVSSEQADGYNECDDFVVGTLGRGGCDQPGPVALFCKRRNCPIFDYTPVEGSCGFLTRTVYAGTYIGTPQEANEQGNRYAFERIYRYYNGKNEWGIRMERPAPLISQWFTDENFNIISGRKSIQLPEYAYTANPPKADDETVTMVKWPTYRYFSRVFGGKLFEWNPEETAAYYAKQREILIVNLERAGIKPDLSLPVSVEYSGPFQSLQRHEVGYYEIVDEA